MITQETVNRLFEYRYGKLYWKDSPRMSVKSGARAGTRFKKVYWKIQFKRKFYLEHRLIFLMFHGWLPKEIDHVSDKLTGEGIKSNKINNLQPISHSNNIQKIPYTWGESKYRGVRKARTAGKWVSSIVKNSHLYYLGTFENEELAAKSYDRAAKQLFGEYCFQNFSKEQAK